MTDARPVAVDTAAGPGAVAAVKPRLRGWLHAGMAPVVLATGIPLVAIAPAGVPRLSVAIYTLAALALFSTSGVYHRFTWSPGVHAWLQRLDHGNVYLFIAGTYTPIVAMATTGTARTLVLVFVWSGAVLGAAFRWLWPAAPRALYTALYVVVGWCILPAFDNLVDHGGPAVFLLTLAGGVLYTAGAVVYGFRRPDPWPRWFGFHEVFHALTVAAWVCQYVAICLLVSHAA
jgi:hemolysin III